MLPGPSLYVAADCMPLSIRGTLGNEWLAENKIDENKNTKHDSIVTEGFEIIFPYVTQQKFDRQNRNYEGCQHTNEQDGDFGSCKMKAELDKL